MKRTLISLAAMAAAGAAQAQSSVTLFGRPEAVTLTIRPIERIGPLLNDPDTAGMCELREAMAREIHQMLSVPAQQIGKTAHAEDMVSLGMRGREDFGTGAKAFKVLPHQEVSIDYYRAKNFADFWPVRLSADWGA